MAFATQFNAEGRRAAILFNTDRAVGFKGSNLKVDVKLVQALLRLFYYDLEDIGGPFSHPAQDPDPPKVDGIAGPITMRLIATFQRQQSRVAQGLGTALDGSFDAFRGNREQSRIRPVFYALETLNLRCSGILVGFGSELNTTFLAKDYVIEQADLFAAISGPLRQTAQMYIDGKR
jgi:peptidoglycan hydrolase-like protein with peptidoglycan-binding domain